MSFTTSNPTQLFSVVGSGYVAESHGGPGHLPPLSEIEQLQIGVTGLWLSLFAAIGLSLIGSSQAARAVQLAAHAFH